MSYVMVEQAPSWIGWVSICLLAFSLCFILFLAFSKTKMGYTFRAWRDRPDGVPHMHMFHGVPYMHSHHGGKRAHSHHEISISTKKYAELVNNQHG